MKGSKIVFGRWEGTALLINTMSTQIILAFPRLMVESGGTAAWMIPLYVSLLALAAFYIITRLYSKFEGLDILDISEHAGGTIIRVIVGSILVVYLIFLISVVLRELAEDMKIIALTNSPISFVTFFLIFGMVFGAYMGIEPIVRVIAIFVPLLIIGLLFITLGVYPYYDVGNLLPVIGKGAFEIFVKSATRISIFSALILLFFIAPFLKNNKTFKSVGYTSIIFSGVSFTWATLSYILVYPYPASLENTLPVYQLARLINFGRFFQRVESIFMLIWASSALLYLSTAFYFILYVTRRTFKLEYHTPLIPPLAIILYTCSFLPRNVMTTLWLEGNYARNYAWIVALVLPILILIIARFKKGNKRKGETEND